MAKQLLVTGASGFLGWNVGLFSQSDWNLLGIYHKNGNGVHPNFNATQLDISNPQSIEDLFQCHKIEGILHLAALSKPNDCAKNPGLSYAINVNATKILAQKAKALNIPFVFTSSSQVYDGDNAPYDENSTVNPISIYAEHKIEAEKVAFEVNPNAIVVRMPLMFGVTSPTSNNFLKQWVNKVRNSETVPTFSDEIRTPVSGQTAIQVLFKLLNSNIKGELFCLGARESVSRTEFAFMMCEVFDLDKQYIRPCLQADVKMAAKRPKDLSLNPAKLIEMIGYEPKGILEELKLIQL